MCMRIQRISWGERSAYDSWTQNTFGIRSLSKLDWNSRSSKCYMYIDGDMLLQMFNFLSRNASILNNCFWQGAMLLSAVNFLIWNAPNHGFFIFYGGDITDGEDKDDNDISSKEKYNVFDHSRYCKNMTLSFGILLLWKDQTLTWEVSLKLRQESRTSSQRQLYSTIFWRSPSWPDGPWRLLLEEIRRTWNACALFPSSAHLNTSWHSLSLSSPFSLHLSLVP